MKIFIDSADPDKIIDAFSTGLIDGVTTNPTLATKTNIQFKQAVEKILLTVNLPVSLEVMSSEESEIVEEARKISKLSPNVVVKIPMTREGLLAVKKLNNEGIKTNVTLVFSTAQALLAAKAGATYVSPFMGRLDDISSSGLELISEIALMYEMFDYKTEIIAASERSARECIEAGLAGADIVTMRYETFCNFFKHPLTTMGIERFTDDWENSKQEPLV